jgi:predicted Rdx family selenoprotein
MNEVQTQLIALQIHQLNLIAEEKEQKGFRSTMKLDYRVLDLLSPEELLELIQIVGDEIESRKNNV